MKAILVGQRKDLDKQDKLTFDSEPKENSQNPVTSDGIYKKTSWISNPNLLDNWYFQDPVNQRGQTTYDSSAYSIDRWKLQGSLTIVAWQYVTIKYTGALEVFDQILEPSLVQAIRGKWVTLSVLSTSGFASESYIVPESGDLDSTNITIGNFSFDLFIRGTNARVRLYSNTEGATINLIAMKLELGTVQTLAHKEGEKWVLNEIPNYADQLAKCQRYQYALGGNTYNSPWNPFGYGVAMSETRLEVDIPIPVTLRGRPTISYVKNDQDLISGTTGTGWSQGAHCETITLNQIALNEVSIYANFPAAAKFEKGKIYKLAGQSATGNPLIIIDANL